ncbi:glycosyltransferase family 2 protein, partial [Kineococcus glutinatus]|uniref:glycosyltransferase family 2 protein n=1 Tax=Kineococcus glutinatus TaxID=1070872 RepID=UPI0031E642BC
VVVRHPRNRGKAAAMETGARAVAERDAREPGSAPRALLFVDADLGATAERTAALVPPVLAQEADMTIAVLPQQATAGGGRGLVVNLARRGTLAAVGWSPRQPLSGMRCLSRAAFEAARPLARGWGVETALTIDLVRAGFRVLEVPCALQHRVTGRDWRGQLHRGRQYRDVALALAVRRRGRRRPAAS